MIEYSFRFQHGKKASHTILWVPREPNWHHGISELYPGWAMGDNYSSDAIWFTESDVQFSTKDGSKYAHTTGGFGGYSEKDATGKLFVPGASMVGEIIFRKMLRRLRKIQKMKGGHWRMRRYVVRL